MVVRVVMAAVLLTACQVNTNEEWEENELESTRTCERKHPDSVSCGWPVYLPDGTRIDGESGVSDNVSS